MPGREVIWLTRAIHRIPRHSESPDRPEAADAAEKRSTRRPAPAGRE